MILIIDFDYLLIIVQECVFFSLRRLLIIQLTAVTNAVRHNQWVFHRLECSYSLDIFVFVNTNNLMVSTLLYFRSHVT